LLVHTPKIPAHLLVEEDEIVEIERGRRGRRDRMTDGGVRKRKMEFN
jgi:hypothetical protein